MMNLLKVAALEPERMEAKKIEAPAEWTIPAEMLAWPPIDPSLLTDEEFGRRYLAACQEAA